MLAVGEEEEEEVVREVVVMVVMVEMPSGSWWNDGPFSWGAKRRLAAKALKLLTLATPYVTTRLASPHMTQYRTQYRTQ